MTDELVPQEIDYKALLEKNKNLQELVIALTEADSDAAKKERISSRQAKIQSWFGKQEDLPAEKVTDLRKRMMNFVDDLFAKVHLDEARELTPEESRSLMAEFLDAEEFKIVFAARREAAKTLVFNHLTAENIEKNIPEPDNHNGSIEVPELGKKFCREGTGREEPVLHHAVLLEKLDKDDYDKITDKERIPSHTKLTVNEEKLMALCREKPAILEIVRKAITIGNVKNPNFRVRDI